LIVIIVIIALDRQKPGNVREFDSCQGNVKEFTKNKGNVREMPGKNLREKLPKTVYCKLHICIHTGINY